MIENTILFIKNTPFYPHWLDFKNKRKGNSELIKYFKGEVLETGCGNCEKKDYFLANSKKITKYVATDYSDWDKEFKKQAQKVSILGKVTEILYGKSKDLSKIDVVCDAMNLPFKKNSFDVYCSFEVLEHISEPDKLISEASRVLKKGGYCLLTSPYLYREHGGIEMDFQRISRGGYYHLAKRNGFKVVKVYTHSYFGTTIAIMINQYVIRKILEGRVIRYILFPISPLIFFITNSIGYFIDLVDSDLRFASSYHVILKKL